MAPKRERGDMLAIDWSHTRNFAIFDGEEATIVPLSKLIDEAKRADKVLIEAGAPLVVIYRLCRLTPTYTVDATDVAKEREERGLSKYKLGIEDDLTDATIIYYLGKDRARLVSLDADRLKLVYLYHQFIYAQKAWQKTLQLKKAMRRHFGDTDNATLFLLSQHEDEYERRMESLRKEVERFAPSPPDSVARIKGMSKWLWAGIVITADPRLFPTKSAYRKYLGLMNRESIKYKFSRNARKAYWLVVDQFIKQNTPIWRELYDDWKSKLGEREKYTHPHSGALNRVATKFADFIWEEVNKKGVIQQGFLW